MKSGDSMKNDSDPFFLFSKERWLGWEYCLTLLLICGILNCWI